MGDIRHDEDMTTRSIFFCLFWNDVDFEVFFQKKKQNDE